VQRSEDGCDTRRFRSFDHSTCKTVLNLLEAVYYFYLFVTFMCNKRHYFKHSARLKHTSKLTISSKTCHIHAEYCKPTLLAGALHSVTQNVIVTGVSTSATSDYCYHFYRAMHFSAKRGVAIARRLSVRLSLCPSATLVDCDHIGWNSSEIISPLVNL